MRTLRLSHPDLDFWVDVRVREFDGRWLAVADLADEPEVGLGWTPRDAVMEALRPLSDLLAAEMALESDLARFDAEWLAPVWAAACALRRCRCCGPTARC